MQDKEDIDQDSLNPNTKNPESDSALKAVRTYEDDVAQALRQKGASLGSVFMAESKKRESLGAQVMSDDGRINKKRILTILLIIFLSLLSIGLLGFLVWKIFLTPAITPPFSLETLIPSDSEKYLNIKGLSPEEVLSLLRKERDEAAGSLGAVVALNLYIKNDLDDGTPNNTPVYADDFFKAIASKAPGKLYRSLLPEFLLGGHIFDGNQPFIVFQVDSYQNAFAGMIEWEKYIKSDLSVFFETKEKITINSDEVPPIASTTPDSPDIPLVPESFEDAVLRNKDVRILRNANGEILLLYSFPDRQTLVITTNENTFRELLDRLSVTEF